MTYWLILLGLLIAFLLGYKLLKKGADKVSDFFWSAWKVYVFKNVREGFEAAVTAATVAAESQRNSFIQALSHFRENLSLNEDSTDDERAQLHECQGRLDELIEELVSLNAQRPGLTEVVRSKAQLASRFPEAANALDKYDADYFYRKFPDIKFD
jgi:hypothetical protein